MRVMVHESTAEIFVPAGATLGEGPSWDAAAGCLAWVDILGPSVHLTEPDGSTRATYRLDRHVGAVLPGSPGYLLARRDGFATLDPATGTVTPLLSVLGDRPELRFNDAKAGPDGRVFAGTMPYDESLGKVGELLRLDPGPVATRVHGPVSLSNGLGWSPDHRLMYYVDTPTSEVTVFDYDVDTATPHSPRTLATIETGHPDGLCVDDEGCVWVALHGGSAVHRYTPQGRLDATIRLPATNVTSCAFGPGGRLYITTARQGDEDQPLAGGLFVAEPGVTGPPAVAWTV
jgi:sugar lactone lactonase YvrE